jgi:hypothetical protein
LNCFVYKLVVLNTLNDLPVAYELVPANSDKRTYAKRVTCAVWISDLYEAESLMGGVF